MCPSDPARIRAHPAAVIERSLLDLNEDDFNAAQPQHAQFLKSDAPAITGVAWIDEAEKNLFEGVR